MQIKKYQNTPGPLLKDIITIGELPEGYLFKYGNRTVVFPSGKRMTLREARKEYSPTHIKISNLPGYSELQYQAQLPYQEQNDNVTALEVEKSAADRFVGSEYGAGNQLYTYLLKPIEGLVPSRIWGAMTTDNASGFGDRFAYAWNPLNRGFFETNDYTRQAYNQDHVGGTILNLAGDVMVPNTLIRSIPKTMKFSNVSKLLGSSEIPDKYVNLIKPINQTTREEKIQYLAKTKELAQRVDHARNLDALRMVKDRLRQGGFKRIRKAYTEDINLIPEESKIFHPQNKMVMQSLDLANESKILNELPIRGTAKQLSLGLSRKAGTHISFNKNVGGKGGTGIGYTTISSDSPLKFQGLKKGLKGAAHEFVHWLYWPASRPKGVNSSVLDDDMLRYLFGYNQEVGSGEIIARGTELKNYFGLKEGEQLTPEMWDYAKRHYLIDVGPNNGTAALFNAVDTKSKDFPLFLLWLNRRAPIVTGLIVGETYNNLDNK